MQEPHVLTEATKQEHLAASWQHCGICPFSIFWTRISLCMREEHMPREPHPAHDGKSDMLKLLSVPPDSAHGGPFTSLLYIDVPCHQLDLSH